jgi:hypothetical protein
LTKEFTDALIFNKKQEFLHFNLLTSLLTLSAQYLCAFTIGRLTLQTSLKPPSDLPVFIKKTTRTTKGQLCFGILANLPK